MSTAVKRDSCEINHEVVCADDKRPDAGDARAASSPAVNRPSELQYAIDDVPPWYLCVFLGFQHYLTMFGATLSIALIIAPAMCVTDNVTKSEILGTIFFVSGLVTLLQSSFGSRLPIIQGGTFAFLVPAFSILALPKWQCPVDDPTGNATSEDELNFNYSAADDTSDPIWKSRMREIQGAIITASVFEVVIGASGIVGFLLRFIGPLSIAPTITLIGISLFKPAAEFCSKQWWIAIMTIFLVVLFSQYLRNVDIPCCSLKGGRCTKVGYPFFKLFPVILAILIAWVTCGILTFTNVLPNDPTQSGYHARTDTKIDVLIKSSWFRFPYPFQWGMPTFSTAGTLGMLAGVAAGMLESVGDYYACARLSGAPPPPIHAVNRGIFLEGVGCILAGMWGSGTGTTSYSENVGAIGITKVGSRRVIQAGGLIILILGMLGKFGALFVTIPEPIIGGLFMCMFGMISAVGISNLQYVDLNSSRNLFVIGFSLFFGLSMPQWVATTPGAIKTGSEMADQILTVLLSTSMFVGGALAFFLDNTIPGTLEERGLKEWQKQLEAQEHRLDDNGKMIPSTYDIPGIKFLRKVTCFRYVPVCPTFTGGCRPKRTHGADNGSANQEHINGGECLENVRTDTVTTL